MNAIYHSVNSQAYSILLFIANLFYTGLLLKSPETGNNTDILILIQINR
jgi:hypothetical protein